MKKNTDDNIFEKGFLNLLKFTAVIMYTGAGMCVIALITREKIFLAIALAMLALALFVFFIIATVFSVCVAKERMKEMKEDALCDMNSKREDRNNFGRAGCDLR